VEFAINQGFPRLFWSKIKKLTDTDCEDFKDWKILMDGKTGNWMDLKSLPINSNSKIHLTKT